MPKHGKKFQAALEKVDLEKQYQAEEALALIKDVAFPAGNRRKADLEQTSLCRWD